MRALDLPHGGVWWGREIRDPQVMVLLVAAACLLLEAVIAKNVIMWNWNSSASSPRCGSSSPTW